MCFLCFWKWERKGSSWFSCRGVELSWRGGLGNRKGWGRGSFWVFVSFGEKVIEYSVVVSIWNIFIVLCFLFVFICIRVFIFGREIVCFKKIWLVLLVRNFINLNFRFVVR